MTQTVVLSLIDLHLQENNVQLNGLITRVKRGLNPIRWSKRTSIIAGAVAATSLLTVALLQPPAIADLSEESRYQLPDLLAQWKRGEVVVLVRHLERCDKEDFPCWEGNDGITARSVAVGQELGDDFFQLGLDNSDIYNSPLSRTAQTEAIVFKDVGKDQEWLFRCRETMLSDAIKSKVPGRNLVLVTHSSCIAKFEQALGYDSETPDYGTALFFSASENPGSLQVLGFLDAEDWDATMGTGPS